MSTMTVTVELPDELGERLAVAAAATGTTPEQLALEAIEARFPQSPGVSFIGVGASRTGQRAGRDHRALVREAFTDRTARDV
jgi:hypothetical protein